MTPDDKKKERLTPAEFTRRMPEGESAGPGAPETDEPVQGRPGAGGHGPTGGPGGPAMKGMGDPPPPGAKSGADDATPDVAGAAATAIRGGVMGADRAARKARGAEDGD
jgi:hypothetical protein